jgi:hypothetical protein
MTTAQPTWDTHDFRVKMLDWSSVKGSRLAYSCRRCGRRFCHFSLLSREAWAIDETGRSLDSTISNRWLAEVCPRRFNVEDNEDRKQLSKSATRITTAR